MSDVAVSAPVAAPVAAPAPAATAPAEVPAGDAKAAAGMAVAALDASKAADAKAAKAEGEPKTEAPPEPRKYKVKVAGEDREVTEEDLVRDYQTREAADKRFKEASKLKSEADARAAEVNKVLEMMDKNPRGFAAKARELGIDPARLAEEILRPLIEEQIAAEEEKEMTPEQLAQRARDKKLAEYEAKEAAAAKAEKEAEAQKVTAAKQAAIDKHTQELSNVIMDALKATKLPQTNETALELADLLQEAIDRGIPVDAKMLAKDLEARKWDSFQRLTKGAESADMIDPDMRKRIRQEALTDPEIVEQIRKQAVKEYKESNVMAASKPVVGPKGPTRAESKKGRTYGAVMRDLQLGKIK